jgi:ankyrin repeat protein
LNNGITPLIYAVRNGAANCVDLFLDAGADINAVETEHGIGAFGSALNRLDLKLAGHLFDRGAEPNFGSIETLPLAIAEHGSLAFIRALEEKGCKLVRDDQRGRMAFISARNPDPEVFDYFLNHGADPSEGNNLGYTPLILAALNNRPTLIRRYLERGEDASARDIDGETALSLALEKRNNEAVDALRGFHVEERDYLALTPNAAMLKAATDGALGTILNLRDDGIAINIEDEEGNSPLMLAVKAGHLGVVRSLYHLGADINHRNHAEQTALALAKESDSTDIVNSLQEFGALDAIDGELGKLSGMFGGIAVFNAADTMFGRMSHPYKDKPPYDNPESDSEAESEEDKDDEADDSDDQELKVEADSASIESKLDHIETILNDQDVRAQLPDATLEHLLQKLDRWRSLVEESEFGADELADLNELLGMLGVAEEKTEEDARTPLFEAVHSQDLSAVKKIIKGGGDVNEIDGEGNTALLIAVLTRQSKLVEELLKLGADPNQARPDGKGPLFVSVRVGEEKIAQMLLKSGAELDAHFSVEHNGIPVGGCTALYAASLLGQLSFCRLLHSNGAQIDAANDLGYTPLMAAIEGGHDDVIDFFLKSGANVNPEVISRVQIEGLGVASPLITATRKEHVALIKKLLKRGVDVNRPSGNGWTPLKSAAQQGNLNIVKVLLEAGADPNIADDTNYTPLMNAVSGEHDGIVKLLLKFHADPNVQSGDNPDDEDWEPGRTALMDAAVSGNVPIARELLQQGANPNLLNSKGWTALHSAVISANTDMVSLLLKAGANVNVYGNDDKRLSAFDLALRRWASEGEDDRAGGISDVLDLMLKKGLPEDRKSLNETIFDLAIDGRSDVIEFLRNRRVNVEPNQLMPNGASILFCLAGVGDVGLDAAKLMLEMGANPSYRSPGGMSVLAMAVRNGATKFAQILLAAGADVLDRNNLGVLAYDLAVNYGHDELVEILIAQMNRGVPEVDKQDSNGDTALMRAVKQSDTKAVSDLLTRCADASRRDLHGDTPLSFAVCRDLVEVVHLFRQAGAERLPGDCVNENEQIVFAGAKGALGSILDLLDSGVSIDSTDAKGDTALTRAEPHPGVVRVLAKLGADLTHRNQNGMTAYMIAAASNRVLMMQALKEVGAPTDDPVELDGLSHIHVMLNELRSKGPDDNSVESDSEPDSEGEVDGDELLMASMMGDAIAVAGLIAAGVDVNYENDEGRTALMMALAGLGRGEMSRRSERDFEQIIDSLLVAGTDPNVGLMPPMILAATIGRLHLVNALIRAGADVNVTADIPAGEHDETMRANVLFVALAPNQNDPHAVERVGLALVRAGIDLSFKSDDGTMAVHFAADAGVIKTLLAILERAPETIDAQNSGGSTPLMMATSSNQLEAIRVLLERQADRKIRNAKGLTAADIAVAAGNQEAASALTQV